MGESIYHSVLTGIAMGDGRSNTAFKRANVSQEVGNSALDYLCENGMIKRNFSKKISNSWMDHEASSAKLSFNTPFIRFWFAFVSPIFKGIQEENYEEFHQRFTNRFDEFLNLTFEQLSKELLQKSFTQDVIVDIGSYWNGETDIDIFAKTASGKTIAGICKYTNTKTKKNELTKLKETCSKAGLKADIFVIFSKTGFSNELKSLKGEDLRLFTLKNFNKLMENTSRNDIVKGFVD